jgi:hypothetical protein
LTVTARGAAVALPLLTVVAEKVTVAPGVVDADDAAKVT